MTSYIIRRSAADHPDGLLRDLVPLLPLLRPARRPGDAHRRRRRPHHRPRRDRAGQRALRARRPDLVQFVNYWERVLQWDLGESFVNRPQRQRHPRREGAATASAWRSGRSLIEIVVGISVGLLSAIRRYSLTDKLTTIGTAAAVGDPGVRARLHPPVRLRRLPEQARLAGVDAAAHVAASAPTRGPLFFIPTGEQWRYLILPAITLACVSTALAARMIRGSMLEVMRADYMRTARAKGLGERSVVLRHGLRNAMIPVVTLIGIDFGTVIGAAVLTETVFSWPGLGSQIADSVGERDLPVILGLTLVVVLAYSLINLLVDLSYAWFDPRIRLGDGTRRMTQESTDGDDRAARRRWRRHRARRPTGSPTSAQARPLRADVWQALQRTSWRWSGWCFIVLLVLVAIFAPLIAPVQHRRARHRSFRAAAVVRPLVRHRHHRPRRVHPGRLRRPGLAEDRHPRHGASR